MTDAIPVRVEVVSDDGVRRVEDVYRTDTGELIGQNIVYVGPAPAAVPEIP